MQNQKVMQTTKSITIPGPVQLAAAILLYLLMALALILSYSTASAAPMPMTWDIQLLTRLHDGTILSLPADDSEFNVYCWGYSGDYRGRMQDGGIPLEVHYRSGTWWITFVGGYDYALWCQSSGMDWTASITEDHDPSGSIIILNAIASQYTDVSSSIDGERPVWSPARCPVDFASPGETVVASLLIHGEYLGSIGDGGPRWQYGVQLPTGCTIMRVVYIQARGGE